MGGLLPEPGGRRHRHRAADAASSTMTREAQIAAALKLLRDGQQSRGEIERALDSVAETDLTDKHAEHREAARRHSAELRRMQDHIRAHTARGYHSALPQDAIDHAVKLDRIFTTRAVLLNRVFMAGAGWLPKVNAAFVTSFSEQKLLALADDIEREGLAGWSPPPPKALKQKRALVLAKQMLRSRSRPTTVYRPSPSAEVANGKGEWHRLATILYGDLDANLYRLLQTFDEWFGGSSKARSD
jgi:hypothetical protein